MPLTGSLTTKKPLPLMARSVETPWLESDPGVEKSLVMLEVVTPVRGVGAESLVTYDTGATLWHWDQVSGDGSILSLQGGLQNGEMVMEGDESGASKHMLVRVTWISNGVTIHEAAERSADGRVWSSWFERDFRRATPSDATRPNH